MDSTTIDASIPDPLMGADGTRVATANDWRAKRRPELLELFRKYVYGRAPVGRPETLAFSDPEVTPGVLGGTATRKRVAVSYTGPGGVGGFSLLLYVPDGRTAPAPVFLHLSLWPAHITDPALGAPSPLWPVAEIIARGYAAAAIEVKEVAPDQADGHATGAHAVFAPPGSAEAPDAWGTIAAWAWGASRALDYLETDPDVDARRVAVLGHSRGGKTSLWAGAQDERFALVISNESGCTGAALTRGKVGEKVADINRGFPHWFCANYKEFAGRENDLPVDQHELLALCAPRPVYVASATEDQWADPQAEFRSCVLASPVYALFGLPGVGVAIIPAPEQPLQSGSIGYHLRTGAHALTRYDWERYLDFADEKFKEEKAR